MLANLVLSDGPPDMADSEQIPVCYRRKSSN